MTGLSIGAGTRGPVTLSPRFANRHCLVTGATGTGKTTTLGTLAEGFARIGTPSLILDVKGDMQGLARGNRVDLLDPFGISGRRCQLDLYDMGPDLIARALDLSDAQSGALDVAFAVADARALPLTTLADFRALLSFVAANARDISESFGLVTPSSLAAVQRAALRLQRDAAEAFGPAALDVATLERRPGCSTSHLERPTAPGLITILSASRLSRTPGLYGALCGFILSDLFDRSPEVGDLDRPRLAVFLDESHLIFEGAPAPLVRRLEMIVRLIRSKGVALIFATQSPGDLPAGIAGQLQNRIQHGLRSATPADARAVRAAADSLPRARGINAAEAIASLGVGQALVSVVQNDGVPSPVDLVRVRPCRARLGPLSAAELAPFMPPPRVVTAPAPARPSLWARIWAP